MGPTRIEVLEIEMEELRNEREKLHSRIEDIGNRQLEIRRELRRLHDGAEAEKVELFWQELASEFGMTEHPKLEKLKQKAWERGHSAGFEDVRNCFIDLLDVVDH